MKKTLEEFLQKTISLEEKLGVRDLVWTYKDVIEVISFLKENGYIILGGDVLTMSKESIDYTYDNWHYDEEDSSKSCEYAMNYIQSYPNKDRYIYCLVFTHSTYPKKIMSQLDNR